MAVDSDLNNRSDADLAAERQKVSDQLNGTQKPDERKQLEAKLSDIDAERARRSPSVDRDRSDSPNAQQPGTNKHNQIDRSSREVSSDGRNFRVDSSEMTYDRDNMKNARSTPDGRKADQESRKGIYSETGRDAAHAHSLSGNADPGDRDNLYAGNSIQNRSGGAKAQIERERDKAIRDGSATSVHEKSDRIYSLDRQGYEKRAPIAEKVTQTYNRPDGNSETREVYLGNFSSSTSRYADARAAKGEKTDPQEMERLRKQDKEHLREQGNGTVKQSQQQTKDLKAREAGGEKVQWGPRLAVDNTQSPPDRPKSSSTSSSPPSRDSAAEPAPHKTSPDRSK
jgi:hypothetical protein